MTPCIAVVGPSGSGKTTLVTGLIKALTARGYRVGALKHTHHDFKIDRPGKDSFALKAAGAATVALVAPHKLALIRDLSREPSVAELISRHFDDVHLVLAEGLTHSDLPKILISESASSLGISNVVATAPARGFSQHEIEQLAHLIEEQFLR